MEVELKSDWLVTQIELLKALHGYVKDGVDDEIGSIDYVSSGDDHGKKLLRVIIDLKANVSKAFTDTVRATVEFLKDEDYYEAVILAKEFTEGAKRLLRKESGLNYISTSVKHPSSIIELLEAVQKHTRELCKLRCGKFLSSKAN